MYGYVYAGTYECERVSINFSLGIFPVESVGRANQFGPFISRRLSQRGSRSLSRPHPDRPHRADHPAAGAHSRGSDPRLEVQEALLCSL
jgi:hypothetical protein